MIIVSDSGPLAYLVAIGVADTLPHLYGDVYIPTTVLSELRHPACPVVAWAKSPPDWLHVAEPSLPSAAAVALDRGERDAIALALELRADRLLMDEKPGRKVAQSLGLNVAGTLAVILDGAGHYLFDGEGALDRLATTNFYASADLLQQVRELLAKHPRKP